MGLISKPYTFSAGGAIKASEHNDNFDTIYTLVNGNISNTNISGSAAIADTKLAQITAADKVHFSSLVAASEAQGAIAYFNGTNWVILAVGTDGQLLECGGAAANPTWTSLAGDVSGAVDATQVTDLTLTSEAQGAIAYFNGSNWVVLGPGTSGYYLKTQGAAANPVWADLESSDYAWKFFETMSLSGTSTASSALGTDWEVLLMVLENVSCTGGADTIGLQVNSSTSGYDTVTFDWSASPPVFIKNTSEANFKVGDGQAGVLINGTIMLTRQPGTGVGISCDLSTTNTAYDVAVKGVGPAVTVTSVTFKSRSATTTTGSVHLYKNNN